MTLLCAGESFEDLIFVGLQRLPGPGEEVKTDRFVATVGGGAVITAVAAARLGMPTRIVSALGPSAVARLTRERVSITNLRKLNEPHAISAALSTTDERAFVTFNGVNNKLEARLARVLADLAAGPPKPGRRLGTPKPRRRRPSHVHLAFYPHDCGRWTHIVSRLRARGITTSWDFGWNEPLTADRGLTGLVDALDFVFVNELEARLYAMGAGNPDRLRQGYSGPPELATAEGLLPHDGALPPLGEVLDRWRRRKAIVIVKQGAEGSLWLAPNRILHVPAPRVKVVDTTGAGDAFNGGFLVAWMRGASPERCLAMGNKIGAASTRKPGGLDALPERPNLKVRPYRRADPAVSARLRRAEPSGSANRRR